MVFEEFILKQEEVIACIDMNWTAFWWTVFIGVVLAVFVSGICAIFDDSSSARIKCVVVGVSTLVFAMVSVVCGLILANSPTFGIKHYETHYTVEAEIFYKSEFTKDYEIVSQDGRLLVVREAPNE